jgi:catechol 2,3-dioxygenase-like lactoylglutathione lyase family enzyme
MTLPMLIGKLFHLGYAVRDVDRATESLGAKFGISNWNILRLPDDSPGRALAFARSGDMILELVDIKPGEMPLYNDWIPDDESALRLHHLGHMAEDEAEWEAVAQQFEALGIPLVFDAEMDDMLQFRYWDTVPLLGHYCEFVLMKPGGKGFWEGVPSN